VAESTLPDESRAAKFLSSQAVMLAMAGVPGIYVHSLLGSGNWSDGVRITGVNRTINREKLNIDRLESELEDPTSLRHKIFTGYARMLKVRSMNPAFSPVSGQEILNIGSGLFALRRQADSGDSVLCLQSVIGDTLTISIPGVSGQYRDLITGKVHSIEKGRMTLNPWEVLWLQEL
jgi:sucrose phosphorylase